MNMLQVKYKPALEKNSTMIGTIFADPETPLWARLHPHDRRFRAMMPAIRDGDGDINFRVRKPEVGTEWRASI